MTGRVTDAASRAPIGGARVTFTRVVDVPGGTLGRQPRQFVTAPDGAFAFEGLEPGEYMLNVEKSGFAPYPDVLGDDAPERIRVDAGRDIQPRHVALNKGAVIAGRIVNAA